MLAPAFDVVTYRRFEDTLVVGVDELAALILPDLVRSPSVTRDVGVTSQHLGDTIRTVMQAAANDGLVRVDTDLGILVAGRTNRFEGL